MKIIDLLNKIANGEEPPKKVKYNGETYHLNIFKNNYFDDINCSIIKFQNLNDEVKVIEEDKEIEKIELDGEYIVTYTTGIRQLMNTNKKDRDIYIKKINELIDKVNSLENKQ